MRTFFIKYHRSLVWLGLVTIFVGFTIGAAIGAQHGEKLPTPLPSGSGILGAVDTPAGPQEQTQQPFQPVPPPPKPVGTYQRDYRTPRSTRPPSTHPTPQPTRATPTANPITDPPNPPTIEPTKSTEAGVDGN